MNLLIIGLALGCGLAVFGVVGVMERMSEETEQAQHEANMLYDEWLNGAIEKAANEGRVHDILNAQGQKSGELYFYAGNSTWCFTFNHQVSCTILE